MTTKNIPHEQKLRLLQRVLNETSFNFAVRNNEVNEVFELNMSNMLLQAEAQGDW